MGIREGVAFIETPHAHKKLRVPPNILVAMIQVKADINDP